MITLPANSYIAGLGSVAAKLNVLIFGLEPTAGGYTKMYQSQLPSSVGTLYTAPATGPALIRTIVIVNTDSSIRAATLWVDGTDDPHKLLPPTNIPAGGQAVYNGTWSVYDADGKYQSAGGGGGGALTDHTHAATGSGANGGGATLSPATFNLPTGTAPTPTVDGQAAWDTDDNFLVVGDGAAQAFIGRPPAVTILTSGSGNYTPPAGYKKLHARGVGGGGGSGGTAATGASTQAAASGGGGGGAFEKWFDAATLGTGAQAYAIGAGGSAGAAGNNNGGAGGNTTFSSAGNLLTGSGGAQGLGAAASGAGPQIAGGAGGNATGGDLNIPGGDGATSKLNVGVVVSFGHGAGSHFSTLNAAVLDTAGQAGKPYGGGAAGATSGNSAGTRAGAAGAAGVLILEAYF